MLNATTELLSLRLAATDLHGNVITQIEQGESFLIKAYIDDRRDEPEVNVTPISGSVSSDAEGFYTAYFNVTFDSEGFEFDPTYGQGGVKYGPTIDAIDIIPPTPNTQYDGYIERLGVQNLNFGVSGEIEVLSFRMIAQAPGDYDMEEAFLPHFHFDVVNLDENINQVPEDWQPVYVEGVPQLERLEGSTTAINSPFYNAVVGADEYFSLHQFGGQRIIADNDVYFEGIDLSVVTSVDADFDLRFVTTPTVAPGGEVNSRPTNVDVIDEWNHFYVEVYAQAPTGSAVQAGFVELSYDTDDFSFVRAIGRVEDPGLRYSVTSTEVDEQNGTIRIGYSSLSTNLGDDRYALIGRIQMKSDMELPADYTSGPLTFTLSSDITLTDSNATVYNFGSTTSAVIGGTATASHNFEVWPVIYDVGANGEDRKVGISDFAGFISQYGKFVNNDPQLRKFDFNNSGKIDLADFSLFIQNYGESDQSPTTRDYPNGYPGTLGGAPLMASSFVLEGEPVNVRSTQPTSTTSSTSPSTAPTQDEPSNISSQTFSTTLPLIQSAPTGFSLEGEPQQEQVASPVEQSTDAVISSLDDQTDLIVLASQDSESSFASEEDEPEFAEQADEVLAIWEDETAL